MRDLLNQLRLGFRISFMIANHQAFGEISLQQHSIAAKVTCFWLYLPGPPKAGCLADSLVFRIHD